MNTAEPGNTSISAGSAGSPIRGTGSAAYAAPDPIGMDRDSTKVDAGATVSQASSEPSTGATSHQADGTSARAPDNSAVNERDRHATLTPMDQGNKDGERQVTAAIRRTLMADKSLSFTAKNVKIITVGSRVTLRGTVKTDQERSTIETSARQTSGVTEVDDQIEVKGK
ncbi:MAG: BON domain-containing protein [Myxococcota bacterium]|nr:BON domain-containing protein [Myxococcota bacterium]